MSSVRTQNRRLGLAIGILCVVLVAGAGWRAWSSTPVGVPQAVEFTDATLSQDFTSATVLALGEATHGTHEFQALRLELLQKVVDAGFTTVALEESFGSVAAVNDWVQGGPGTVEEAVQHFGYAVSRTEEMAALLSWARNYNADRPDANRVQFVGIDVQRPSADKAVALGWLATVDAELANALATRLAGLTDDTRLDSLTPDVPAALDDLVAAIRDSADDSQATSDALHAAEVLQQGRALAANWSSPARDRAMFENLRWLTERGAGTGRNHTLLFAHDGHVDRAAQATSAGGQTVGSLAAASYGDAYRAIGTDAHHTRFLSGDGANRQEFSLTLESPYRGMFAGTQSGYLEVARASGPNAEIVHRPTPMVSAGEQFAGWYALFPPLHSVTVVPIQAWDAIIYLEHTTPVTMLG